MRLPLCLIALVCVVSVEVWAVEAWTVGAPADTKPRSDVVLRGALTGEDNQTWRFVPFDVPAGTTRITVDFDYTTRDARTTIDLGLLGPDGFRGQDGFRGWSGGNKRSFTVSASDATPSYLPGPIRPGKWNLLLGIPNIRPDTKAEFTAGIRFERTGVDGDAQHPHHRRARLTCQRCSRGDPRGPNSPPSRGVPAARP